MRACFSGMTESLISQRGDAPKVDGSRVWLGVESGKGKGASPPEAAQRLLAYKPLRDSKTDERRGNYAVLLSPRTAYSPFSE